MMNSKHVVVLATMWMALLVWGFGLPRDAGAVPVGGVDGEWVLAANSPHAELYVYNVKTGQVVEHVGRPLGTDGGGVFDMAITPDGKTGNLEISLYRKGALVGTIATVPVTDLQYAWKAGQYDQTKYLGRVWCNVKIRTVDGAHEDMSPGLKLTK
ncbi:MAG: hypothetical protein AB1714_28960 [Acidobacteriota bacterium]